MQCIYIVSVEKMFLHMSYIRKVKMEVGEVIMLTCPCNSLVDQGALTMEVVSVLLQVHVHFSIKTPL